MTIPSSREPRWSYSAAYCDGKDDPGGVERDRLLGSSRSGFRGAAPEPHRHRQAVVGAGIRGAPAVPASRSALRVGPLPTSTSAMRIVVTTVPLKRALSSAKTARPERGLPPLAADRPAYRGLYWGMADQTEALRVSVWDSPAHADATSEAITPWIREGLGPVVAGPPQHRAAEVLVPHRTPAGDWTGGSR